MNVQAVRHRVPPVHGRLSFRIGAADVPTH